MKTATGLESGGTTNRLQEQFGYGYDAAHNLNFRTNNALIQGFNVNNLNELTTTTNGGTLTVAGATTPRAVKVTVNSLTAALYGDYTFALAGFALTNGDNTFTAVANDVYGGSVNDTVIMNLPSANNYSYDLNGNLLSDGNRCFAYDDENELTSVWVTNTWRSDFLYDGKLRRRIRREYTWNGTWNLTNEVHYIYDGNLVIQERNALNLPQVAYTRGKDLSGSLQGAGGIGGLLALSQLATATPQHFYYHSDGNGNVTMLTDTNQLLVAKYEYDAYGNLLAMSGPMAAANLYRFSSKEWNASSGLYYYLYRFYDPNLQRWVNRDPLEEIGFEVTRMLGSHFDSLENAEQGFDVNLYDFAGNMVLMLVDVDGLGLFPVKDWPIWHWPLWHHLVPDTKKGKYNQTYYCLGYQWGGPDPFTPPPPPNAPPPEQPPLWPKPIPEPILPPIPRP